MFKLKKTNHIKTNAYNLKTKLEKLTISDALQSEATRRRRASRLTVQPTHNAPAYINSTIPQGISQLLSVFWPNVY